MASNKSWSGNPRFVIDDRRVAIFAPTVDMRTERMADWVRSGKISSGRYFLGDRACHREATRCIREIESGGVPGLIIVLSHGVDTGPLTNLEYSKEDENDTGLGLMVDSEDIKSTKDHLVSMIWACKCGVGFGPPHSSMPSGGFFGFTGDLHISYNWPASEDLWTHVIKCVVDRIRQNGGIGSEDAEWFRSKLLDIRTQIKKGILDTGKHNKVNCWMLKEAADMVVVY